MYVVNYNEDRREYIAYNNDNYCGCVSCNNILGYGDTEQEALDNLEECIQYNTGS